MAMILSRNDPYSQNDMEINQLNQMPMIPNFTSQPCFVPYNAGAPSQYGPPPSTQIYPNTFPPSCPPEYENKQITSEVVIISKLNADAAEFVPKQRATASSIGDTPVVNSGQPIINSNFTNVNQLSYQPKIDYLQKNEGFLPNSNFMHKVPLDQQSQNENFKQINFTHSNQNWTDRPPNEESYYQDKTKRETYSHRGGFIINEGQNIENLDRKELEKSWSNQSQYTDQIELRQDTGLNRKDSVWYQRQNTEHINKNEFRQDNSGTLLNIKDTKQADNTPHREFRPEKGNANWRHQSDFTDQTETGSNRRYWRQNAENINYKDKSTNWSNPKQGGRNAENSDHREFRHEKSWPNQNEHSNYKHYKSETGSNKSESNARNDAKNVNTNQRDFRQEKSGAWSNYKDNARQNFENLDHKDRRPDRSANRQLGRENVSEEHQRTSNKGDHVYRQDRSHSRRDRDRQNADNLDLKEPRPERTLNRERRYNSMEKNETKGKPEDGQQESRDNGRVHRDEDQNKYDKKSYVFRNQKFHNKSHRDANADNDFNSRKKKYDDEDPRRSAQRKNYPKDQKYRQQKSDSQTENSTAVDEDKKRTGSDYSESNDQKPQTEIKKPGKFKDGEEVTALDEETFKKQATRNRKQYRKEENGNTKKYRDLKQERDGSFNNSGLQEEQTIEDQLDRSLQSQDDEYRKFFAEIKSKITRKPSKIKEAEQDLLDVPDKYSLAHCVAEDFRMGRGVAVGFKRKFKSVDELLAQRQPSGGLAVLRDADRFVYYLVTKPRSYHKPTYKDFWNSARRLRDHVVEHGVRFLAVPKLGCGLDKLDWSTVRHVLEFLFQNVEIEILYCRFGPNEDAPQRSNYQVGVYDLNDRLADVEDKSVILYFSTVDGQITDEMKELDEKFKFLDEFKTATKTVGAVLKHAGDKHAICGCIVRGAAADSFDFKAVKKCLYEINKITKSGEYTGLAMNEIRDDGDALLHHKVITMLVHYLRYVDVYVYKEESDVSVDET